MRLKLTALLLVLPVCATAQDNLSYADAMAVVLEHADIDDAFKGEDGTTSVTYRYAEAEECVLKSTSDILGVYTSGTTQLRGSSSIPLGTADPNKIVVGQSEVYGGFVEIGTLYSERTVRKTISARDLCTVNCINGEAMVDTFVIETDRPDAVAMAVKALVGICTKE